MARHILITGATRGIGLELARQLAAPDVTLFLAGRNIEAATARAAEIGGNAHPVQLDTSDGASIKAAAREIEQSHGHLDVLVNNAGGCFDYDQMDSTVDLALVSAAMEINFYGSWRVTQAFLPLLRKTAHGRIVNVSSEKGSIQQMTGGVPAYATSKAALNALTRNLAAELAPDGISVFAACPGWTATDLGGAGGRPVAQGAASIRFAVDLLADAETGAFYQDGKVHVW